MTVSTVNAPPFATFQIREVAADGYPLNHVRTVTR